MALEYPQSETGCHTTTLNAGNGVVCETPRHQESDVRTVADNSPVDEYELRNSAPDVSNDISSCLEYAKADKANDLAGPDGPPSSRI